MVLVTRIQCVVGAFDEDFRPLDEGGGQETGKGTDDNFLEKRGVHRRFYSSEGATLPTLCSKFALRHGSCGFSGNDQPGSSSTRWHRRRSDRPFARTRAGPEAHRLATGKATEEILPFPRVPLPVSAFRGLPDWILLRV